MIYIVSLAKSEFDPYQSPTSMISKWSLNMVNKLDKKKASIIQYQIASNGYEFREEELVTRVLWLSFTCVF